MVNMVTKKFMIKKFVGRVDCPICPPLWLRA